jgi:hypothetical protein
MVGEEEPPLGTLADVVALVLAEDAPPVIAAVVPPCAEVDAPPAAVDLLALVCPPLLEAATWGSVGSESLEHAERQ